jgi:hypothetical protein
MVKLSLQQAVEVLRVETSRLPHGAVFSLTLQPAFTPQEDSWYSFPLKAESTTGPQCGWKD